MRYDLGDVITAMVTPFNEEGFIDYDALERLINHLIKNGSDAILVAGSTGETPTLSHEEEHNLFDFVSEVVNHRVKLVFGAGSNSTYTAIKSAQIAKEKGADAILSVVPYYNKPSQKGMYTHFSEIAKSVNIPIILYNIPSRTGVNMLPSTVAKLALENKNIVAIKQSNSDLDLISDIKSSCPSDFAIYSGDDSLTLPMLSLGANGVISVASHIVGPEIKSMIKSFKSGDIQSALKQHLYLYPIFKKLFMAPNPVPVKEALTKMGIILNNTVRNPLVNLDNDEFDELWSVVSKYVE